MKNKVVLVTGDSSGFGLEMVKLFIKEGYKVYGVSTGEFQLEGLTHYICDVSNFNKVKEVVNLIVNEAGNIDILVNNAGFGISGAVENTSVEVAHKIFDVNFFGAFNMAKAVLPFMRKNKLGKIINISSIASAVALPFQAFYSASKSAMDTLFTALMNEVHDYNIKIVSIMPGDAKTNFTKRRVKDELDKSDPYYDKYFKSIKQMEKDEENGFAPIKVAKKVLKVAKQKNPPLKVTVGTKDSFLFLIFKVLPLKVRYWIVRKIYSK